ncbi:FCD domain-containing protein [Klebsiella pneumoniae]|nr:FCD domain-containing protein [Klebsiella pneumoniae]
MTAIPQATAIDGYRWLKNDIIRRVYHPDEKLRMKPADVALWHGGRSAARGAFATGGRAAGNGGQSERLSGGAHVGTGASRYLRRARQHGGHAGASRRRERGGDEWEAELLARAHLLNKLESCEASEHLLDEWDQRHQAFHTAIVAGCGSQYLLQMRERLFRYLAARYRFIWLRTTVLSVEMLEDKHVQHQTTGGPLFWRATPNRPAR